MVSCSGNNDYCGVKSVPHEDHGNTYNGAPSLGRSGKDIRASSTPFSDLSVRFGIVQNAPPDSANEIMLVCTPMGLGHLLTIKRFIVCRYRDVFEGRIYWPHDPWTNETCQAKEIEYNSYVQ